ncbi:diaminobutyrate acetyltransferase [Pikeienuella piscinae]|uniref:L-2,4-diaminobutyric acid acetyltransferase n=2 Tax=Pikeienuella piscinae TaxID=2748098 RepID=A0A7M3T5L4_9RHOB|nr:diaminobutyrate acetyltransferase [Pikeienuella piscinae]
MSEEFRMIIETPKGAVRLRKPKVEDGSNVWDLIGRCKPLDENSMYFNLVQCDHFAETCILAEQDGELIGWISGHIPPEKPDTLFVWQVAVDGRARGMGLAHKMLDALIQRPVCDAVVRIETTITKENDASWALFRKFARESDAEISDEPHFERGAHFDGAHDTEHLVSIELEAEAERSAA